MRDMIRGSLATVIVEDDSLRTQSCLLRELCSGHFDGRVLIFVVFTVVFISIHTFVVLLI